MRKRAGTTNAETATPFAFHCLVFVFPQNLGGVCV